MAPRFTLESPARTTGPDKTRESSARRLLVAGGLRYSRCRMALVRTSARHVLGPYELGERIGSGGMAEVYVGRRSGPHGFSRRFAIKRILPELARDPRFVAMFCDEARTLGALDHPNIVQIV